ncbi:class I SAM-dependent methyltransferase [uncultured Ruegeria sp.]|uniref:class I SAM-dependent methyltransferase n=1 Tax=uncultured Ruegeria sp. TaxID=259304 RepID=UPI00261796CF|nr:class I SAM-dependent methyltransferase [uncultured Ruegeria sp.]
MGADQVDAAQMTHASLGYENRAQFYDIEYSETRDHGFLTSMIGSGSQRIMVLPGGTGTTALALHQARPDCATFSVDIEPEMVLAARARFEGIAGAGRAPVSVWGDMTDLAFDQPFDRILVAREAFQMLPDVATALACLASMKQALAPGGQIVLDIANFDCPAARSDLNYYDTSRTEGQPYLDCRQPYGAGLLLRHVTQYSDPNGDRRFQLSYQIETEEAEKTARFEASLALRRYDLPAVKALVAQTGLTCTTVYGDYDRSSFTADAPRICCILE